MEINLTILKILDLKYLGWVILCAACFVRSHSILEHIEYVKIVGKYISKQHQGVVFCTEACISLPYGPGFSVKMFSFLIRKKAKQNKKPLIFTINGRADLILKLVLWFVMSTGHQDMSTLFQMHTKMTKIPGSGFRFSACSYQLLSFLFLDIQLSSLWFRFFLRKMDIIPLCI